DMPVHADCPSILLISDDLAAFFHAFQGCFSELERIFDGFGDLGCRRGLAGKRQFARDQLTYVPAGTALPELLGTIRGVDIGGGNMLAKYLQSFSKSLLPGFDQLGFLGLLFA